MRLKLLVLVLFVSGGVLEAQQAATNNDYARASTGEVGLSAVIDQPGPVIGCGQAVTLTATVTGALEISWKRNGEFINGATTTTFVANQPGTYSVVAVSLLCEVESADVEVILESPLNAAILVPFGNTACSGDTVQLIASGGTAQWQWYRNGVELADGNGTTYNATLAGSYTVVGNESSVCASTSLPIEVVINPLPEAQLIWGETPLICESDSALIIAQLEPQELISWFYDESEIGSGPESIYVSNGGHYVAVITNAESGCSALTNTLTLEVLQTQEVSIADVSGTVICEGQVGALTLTAGQGLIQWFLNDLALASETGSVLSVSMPGVYSAQIAEENGCVAQSNEISMEVVALPNTSLNYEGAGFLCGDEDTLHVSVEPGHVYAWYMDGALLEDEFESALSIVNPGEYAVEAVNSSGCSSVSQPLQVEMASVPGIELQPSGVVNLCEDQTQYFEAISSEAIQYNWFLNGVQIEDAVDNYLEATEAGVYTAHIIDSNGCEALSEETNLQILIVEDPVITDGGITAEGQLLITQEASGHQWFLNGEFIPGATGASYLATEDGVYTVLLIEDVCESMLSDGFEVILSSVHTLTTSDWLAFPNPCSDQLVIRNRLGTPYQFRVYNTYGKLIYSGLTTDATVVIKTQDWSSGIYTFVTEHEESIPFSVVH